MQTTDIGLDKSLLFSAISNSLAMILFNDQGQVLWVNDHFAHAMEYEAKEMIGLHHRQFCLNDFVSSPDYARFWSDLRGGKAFQDKIKRVTKNGSILTLEATYTPVMNEENRVQAVIKVATDITVRDNILHESTTDLMAMVEEMTSSTDEILGASQKIADTMNAINLDSQSVKESVENIQQITAFVQTIASQSHLLGLNASIEAARAGEHGRGFEVVANEVRKMAETSKNSARDISEQLQAISVSVASMTSQVEAVTNQVNANVISINELKIAYTQVASNTEKLASTI